jgi:hypothetical protein
MRSAVVLGAWLVTGCGSPLPRPLPPGMKGSCEPPGGTLSAAVGPARPGPRIRVTVRDLDGVDRAPDAEVTVTTVTLTEQPELHSALDPAVAADHDAQVRKERPYEWLGLHGGIWSEPLPIAAGKEVALASPAPQYWLDVMCDGNLVGGLLPDGRDRLVDITVTLDCSGGWGLPIIGRSDRARDGIGWHRPEWEGR